MTDKRCSSCNEVKVYSEFDLNKSAKDGRNNQCKTCRREWRVKNRERLIEVKRKYYLENKQRCNERTKENYKQNKERTLEQQRQYRLKNEEKIKEGKRKSYLKNKEKHNERTKLYYLKNKRKLRRAQILNEIERKNRDPGYRCHRMTSKRIRNAMVRVGRKKIKSTSEIFNSLGYSANELAEHIERQFLTGMAWDNYGDWHIDHIVPVASFDFTSEDDDEFKACWALTNLRPLWAKDNIAKGSKILSLV